MATLRSTEKSRGYIHQFVPTETVVPDGTVEGSLRTWDPSTDEWEETTNALITDLGVALDVIEFDTSAEAPDYQEGRLFYDDATSTLTYYNDEPAVSLNIGEESWINVRNTSGSTITSGSAVYIDGATGNKPNIFLAQADDRATSGVVGLATHDIEHNSNGYVTTFGVVRKLDTTAFSEGDLLFLSNTVPGGLTTTEPSFPNFSVSIGTVLLSHVSNGSLQVSLGPELDRGVSVQPGTATGNTLYWDGSDWLEDDAIKRTSLGAELDVIEFDTTAGAPAYAEGRMFYDDLENTVAFYNDEAAVTVNLGQENYLKVRNETGVTITNGSVCYVNGATGAFPTIALAQADTQVTAEVSGVATHDIEDNSVGYLTVLGKVNDIDTSSFTAGDVVYLSPTTPGEFTTTEPSLPNFVSPVGIILTSNLSTGSLQVTLKPQVRVGTGVEEGTATGNTVYWDGTNYRETDAVTVDPAGSVELQYNGVKAAETHTRGIHAFSATDETPILDLHGVSGTAYFRLARSDGLSRNLFQGLNAGDDVAIQAANAGGSTQTLISGDPDGSVIVTYAGNTAAETFESGSDHGLRLRGNGSNVALYFADNAGTRLSQMNHASSGLFIDSFVHGDRVIYRGEDTGGSLRNLMILDPDGSADLYHNGSVALETISGSIKFGTHTALAGETVTGYITVQDSAGNSRKLAVVS